MKTELSEKMMGKIKIRYAIPPDFCDMTEIYNYYVINSNATFDVEAISVEEYSKKLNSYKPYGLYRSLVVENDGKVVGFCSTNPYRSHQSFDETVEVSVYLHADHLGKGVGKKLYNSLFASLKGQPIHTFLAGIAMPNDGSIALHKHFGFEAVGVFKEYAKKHDEYIDSVWLQKPNTPVKPVVKFEKYFGDSEPVKELIFSILESYGLPPAPDSTDKDIFSIESLYFENNGWFEGVYDPNNRLIGTWGLLKINDESVELRKMYLCPSFRGQGLGQLMLERALAKAATLEYRWVELETASVLKEAIELYYKYGFREFKRAENLASRCDQTQRLELR